VSAIDLAAERRRRALDARLRRLGINVPPTRRRRSALAVSPVAVEPDARHREIAEDAYARGGRLVRYFSPDLEVR
jgi:hypothetical protein